MRFPSLKRLAQSALLGLAVLGAGEGIINLTPLGGAGGSSNGFTFHRSYTLQRSNPVWLCYGWANGTLRCTKYWHRAGGVLVSDNPAWVPNHLPATGRPVAARPTTTPHGISQWAYTGRAAYYVGWKPGAYPGNQCTWYAWSRNPGLWGLGNARNWYANAKARGIATGFTPRVGATVVFQAGVQGAGALGHVGHVEAVYANGWFLISEMNFYWNGGGPGRVDYRYAHTGSGVRFVY